MQDNERRITELDGIRGLAALGVVFYHYHHHFAVKPFDVVLFPLYRGGGYFVDLFFVLSGFILAQVYSYDARYPTFRAALVSRVARLYPLHLATLIFVAIFQKLHVLFTNHGFIYTYNDAWHFLLNVFLLNDSGIQKGFSFNGPSWSISTEFLVNVLFVAVALRSPKRALWLGCVLAGGIALTQSIVGWSELPRLIVPFHGMLRCCLGFGIGLVLRSAFDRFRTFFIPTWAVEAALVAILGLTAFAMSRPEHVWIPPLLTLLCFPTLVLLALKSTLLGSIVRTRPVVYLGHISFSLYLLHFPIELTFTTIAAVLKRTLPFDNPLLLAAHVAACIAVSHLVWKYFEMPARQWIKRATT